MLKRCALLGVLSALALPSAALAVPGPPVVPPGPPAVPPGCAHAIPNTAATPAAGVVVARCAEAPPAA
jgi:hypothetical protein